MKVIIDQQNLTTCLSFLQKAIPTKPQLPVLSSVYMKAHADGLDISATDLYFGVKTTVPITELSVEGEMIIPGKLFKETVTALPQGGITLEKKETKLSIKAKNVKTDIQSQPSEEYPPFPIIEGITIELSYDHIVAIEKLVTFSASTDVARPVLTALLFRLQETGLQVVATDGFRLSILTISDIQSETPEEFLLPSNAFSEISRIMNANSSQKAQITISKELKQVVCNFGMVSIFIRLIEGSYPPFEKIIPTVFTTEMIFGVEELIEQLKRSLIFARDSSNIVTMIFESEQTVLKATSPAFGTYEGILEESKMTGESAQISFNARYLLDFLQSIKKGTVWFGMNDSLKPALFKHTEIPEFQYIVMPFKVNT